MPFSVRFGVHFPTLTAKRLLSSICKFCEATSRIQPVCLGTRSQEARQYDSGAWDEACGWLQEPELRGTATETKLNNSRFSTAARWHDRTIKHIHVYDWETISDTFRLRQRETSKHRFQVLERTPSDGARGPQSKSFYYPSIREWNDLPEDEVIASLVNEFNNRLDSNCKSHRLKYAIN